MSRGSASSKPCSRTSAVRPWFDESFRSLSILRRLSEAFPVDGSVSAKTVKSASPRGRSPTGSRELPKITCTGPRGTTSPAADHRQAQRGQGGVRSPDEQIRGKSPLEFTLNFHWNESSPMNITRRQQLLGLVAIAVVALLAGTVCSTPPLSRS